MGREYIPKKFRKSFPGKTSIYQPDDYPKPLKIGSRFKIINYNELFVVTILSHHKLTKPKILVYEMDFDRFVSQEQQEFNNNPYAWRMYYEDPEVIKNIKMGNFVSHSQLINYKKDRISESEYAKLFLLYNIKVEAES